jgi:PIN domain nuclease of toxin-antitoxin system
MILLDTHVVVWLLTSPERISKVALKAMAELDALGERPVVSSVTIYEIAYGARRGRIRLHVDEETFLARMRVAFDFWPITDAIAFKAASLPEPFHGDPMDRMIAATAITLDCVLITADERIRDANLCKVLW